MNDSIKFVVGAGDDTENGLGIPITVIVSDENDNPPVFSQVTPLTYNLTRVN